MKRIIILATAFVMALAIAPVSGAQIKAQKDTLATKQVATIAKYWTWVTMFKGTYFLDLKSTNQYDGNLILPLGKTKEEVVESIGALEEMFTAGDDDSFEIRDVVKHRVRVTKGKMMGAEYLYFHTDGFAGYSQIDKGSFKKLRKWAAQLE